MRVKKVGKTFKETKMDAVVMEVINQGIYDVLQVETLIREFTDCKESLFTDREYEEQGFSEEDFEIKKMDN